MSNYTRWYTTGDVKATNGSKTITGTGTYWKSAGLNPGDLLTLDNGNSFKEIASINSDTSITLAANYTGATVTGADYAIVRNFTATTPAQTAAMAAELMGDFAKYIDTDMQKLNGKSAYDIAKEHGYSGTEAQWLESLKGGGEITALKARMDTAETFTAALAGYGRNSLYRHNLNLGGSFTEEQATAISSGTFAGMYLGARWLRSTGAYYFRIIGFNHFHIVQNYQSTWIAPGNHIVVEMFRWDTSDLGQFHSSTDLTGGLKSTKIYTQIMPEYLSVAESFFGADHIQPLYAKVCDARDLSTGPTHFTVSEDKIFMFTPSQILGVGTYDAQTLYLNFRRQFPYFRFNMPNHGDCKSGNPFWTAAIAKGTSNPYLASHNEDELETLGMCTDNRHLRFYLLIK